MTNASQELRLQRYLAQGHGITALQAWRKLGIARLAARIHGLRRHWRIRTDTVRVGRARIARYTLEMQR